MIHANKKIKCAGVVVGVFLVCWVPFFCVNIVQAYCKCIPPLAFQALTWLGYFNSCLNPIIYSIFNTEFRNAFRKILFAYCPACCMKCCPLLKPRTRSGRTWESQDSLMMVNGFPRSNALPVEEAKRSLPILRKEWKSTLV